MKKQEEVVDIPFKKAFKGIEHLIGMQAGTQPSYEINKRKTQHESGKALLLCRYGFVFFDDIVFCRHEASIVRGRL